MSQIAQATNLSNKFENYTFEMIANFTRGQCIKHIKVDGTKDVAQSWLYLLSGRKYLKGLQSVPSRHFY